MGILAPPHHVTKFLFLQVGLSPALHAEPGPGAFLRRTHLSTRRVGIASGAVRETGGHGEDVGGRSKCPNVICPKWTGASTNELHHDFFCCSENFIFLHPRVG